MEADGDGPDGPLGDPYGPDGPESPERPLLRLVPQPPTSGPLPQPAAEPDPLAEAYAFAREILQVHPAQARGYRLFWVRGRDLGWKDLAISEEDYAVLGCHDRCDLRLPDKEGVALRHLLATAIVLKDGSVALRLLDLHTNLPFVLDGREHLSICASGPVLCRLGDYVVGGLPLQPRLTGPAGPAATSWHDEVPRYTTSQSLAPPVRSEQVGQMSHVTVLPRAATIESLPAGPARPGHGRVTLHGQGRASSVEIAESDLHAGVLIGRSDACLDRGLRAALNGHISRVHLLLLLEHDRVYAFDLCSTNGTRVDGQRVRRHRLRDRGTTLLLAGSDDEVTLIWHPRHRPHPP